MVWTFRNVRHKQAFTAPQQFGRYWTRADKGRHGRDKSEAGHAVMMRRARSAVQPKIVMAFHSPAAREAAALAAYQLCVFPLVRP